MVYYKILLGACLLLLLAIHISLAVAQKKGDASRLRVLHFFRIGLSLSAISYLLRLMGTPQNVSLSLLSFGTCLSGTMFLWLGWMEHGKIRWERLRAQSVPRADEDYDGLGRGQAGAEFSVAAGGKDGLCLNTRAHQALLHAQAEACRRQDCCVDTDHLLLGLLQDPHSAGVHILGTLGVIPEKVHLELLGQMPRGESRAKAEPAALTDRADQVLALAGQEAHRFGKASVGTAHLLLGLVLVGKGKAAEVLFGEGVTVDGVRAEVLKSNDPPDRKSR